ncbi:MAG: plasminogen receptor (KT) [Oscillospiraceae bacterium]|nr:plasminogen receptor (KT) [Oscillospiraceae bacterium]
MRFIGATGRKDRLRTFLRWFFYSLALLFFYMLMSGGFFKTWQPIFIIPLAVGVAMRERELSAAIFGAVCGLVIDIACGKLFGFTGVWLIPGCLACALLVSHLIKANLINFIWVNAVVCAFTATADYFFRYVMWGADTSGYILTGIIIPAYLSAIIFSPFIYFMVKLISIKLSPREIHRLSGSSEDDEDEYEEYYKDIQ